MLQDLRELIGCKIGATDGEIGHVKDFYFDDRSWMVRYMVVDTGTWMTGRQVLLSPEAFGLRAFGKSPDDPKVLRVTMSRQKIEDSPSIDEHKPVSLQQETAYYQHYGWPMYRSAESMSGVGAAFPIMLTPVDVKAATPVMEFTKNDVHLRSMREVTGYALGASDGDIGKVAGFLVEAGDGAWRIREMAVETGHWYAGKEIFVTTSRIVRISHDTSTVEVALTRQDIEETAANDLAQAVD